MKSKKWEQHALEEHFSPLEKKEGRFDRKMAQKKDRSKYKKTDRDKRKLLKKEKKHQILEKEELTIGRVLSITTDALFVDVDGEIYQCTLKGVLKKEKTEAKNLVVVGDFVHFRKLNEGEGTICYVDERKTSLSRADNLDQRKEQLIAANIDQVLITSSLLKPHLKPSLIDRYIIATKKGGMEPVILINKIDLIDKDPEEKVLLERFLLEYAAFGWKIICTSTETGEGLDELKEVMRGKASVFSGQSGVGKSSLINSVAGLDLRVGKTVERTRKGSHTTTFASLLKLPFGGFCIDTPGIKSFGVWKLDKQEMIDYFFSHREIQFECKFPSCTHSHEPSCGVLEAVERGEYSRLRYESYLALLEELEGRHVRR